MVHYAPSAESSTPSQSLYTLRQSYRGAPGQSVKPYGSKGLSKVEETHEDKQKPSGKKMLCPSRRSVVKRCFAGDEDHFAQLRYGREEISISFESLKVGHPTAHFKVENPAVIHEMEEIDDEYVDNKELDGTVQWP